MIYFLTSSPFGEDSPYLSDENGFLKRLSRALPPSPCRALFVCSDPEKHAFTGQIAGEMRFALDHAGFSFSSFPILDGRNAEQADQLVRAADLIILAGGHVPTQNAFFQKIGLAEILKPYDGVILGISAGTMNCAEAVYAQPEMPGEAISASYRRFLPGLGITKTNILPHYQMVKDDILDGMRLFEEITYPDSLGRTFYALPDRSYLMGENGREEIFGEYFIIQNGALKKGRA